MPEPVELRLAHEWTCPECGTDHFERAIVVEMAEEDKEHLREEYGIDDAATGQFVAAPDEVTCPDCGRTFETEEPDCGRNEEDE